MGNTENDAYFVTVLLNIITASRPNQAAYLERLCKVNELHFILNGYRLNTSIRLFSITC